MAKKNTPIESGEWHADREGNEIAWPSNGVLVMWRAVDPTKEVDVPRHSLIPFTVQHPVPVVFERRNGFKDEMSELYLYKGNVIDHMRGLLDDVRKQYDEHFDWIEKELRDG